MTMTFLRQPLLHFVVFGALLFAFYSLRTPEESPVDEDVIVVERQDLLEFMQFRANAFDPDSFAERLDGMNQEQRQRLVEAYVREEALYREALAMGLDQGDYNIKQRLIEKLTFLLEDSAGAVPDPDDAELRAYYEDNIGAYERGQAYSFTHVFLADRELSEAGRDEAEAMLARLAEEDTGFYDAGQYGDEFPFMQVYTRRSFDFVRNNFGSDFVAALDELPVDENRWQGPLESRYGYHLVMLTEKRAAFVPELEEIRARVLEDYKIEQAFRQRREAEDRLIDQYDTEVRGL